MNSNSGYILDSKSFQISAKELISLHENSIWQVVKSSKDAPQSSIVLINNQKSFFYKNHFLGLQTLNWRLHKIGQSSFSGEKL